MSFDKRMEMEHLLPDGRLFLALLTSVSLPERKSRVMMSGE